MKKATESLNQTALWLRRYTGDTFAVVELKGDAAILKVRGIKGEALPESLMEAICNAKTDTIHVPTIGQYENGSEVMYHQFCLHEASYSTGATSRFNRDGIGKLLLAQRDTQRKNLLPSSRAIMFSTRWEQTHKSARTIARLIWLGGSKP